MSRSTQLRFFLLNSGFVVSWFKDQVLWPVLDFAGMKPENGFAMNYNLQKMPYDYTMGKILFTEGQGTKKVPLDIKNLHRAAWGMKPVKTCKWSQ